MKIHISESCNESLRGTDFETDFRGLTELKVWFAAVLCLIASS